MYFTMRMLSTEKDIHMENMHLRCIHYKTGVGRKKGDTSSNQAIDENA